MARILIVDDSQTERAALTALLEQHGHQVMTATDGQSGVESAKAHRPEIILMDVVMPGLNGFQATRKISNDPATSHIPIIMVSTKDQETDKVWGTRQGARAYLVKPVEEQDLLEVISEFLG